MRDSVGSGGTREEGPRGKGLAWLGLAQGSAWEGRYYKDVAWRWVGGFRWQWEGEGDGGWR